MADVKVDFSGFHQLRRKINEFSRTESRQMMTECANGLAAIYLGSAKVATPVGGNKEIEVSEKAYKASNATAFERYKEFKAAKAGGGYFKRAINHRKTGQTSHKLIGSSEHMRRSWTSSGVERKGRNYRVKVYNTASYASFVDVGHRQTPGRFVPILGKRLVNNWVEGLDITGKAEKATKKAQRHIINSVISKHMERLK
ncbi:HK97 gp10 family phage protein [Megasphaera vaginalis (ex Srinivasan et al. 2021)]|uniref:Tail protein, HK97 family n=1 Tax=Megasphaera vaginalis (ex Srinivasan et al. 2021) TaxID=1111454 RepID=U7UPM8_9FIRM|nr:HK97 gp10 family phage protein [Megasphaera vaginalis (ex Srinivasan et al. 2021)]ERT61270.1 tail protein, HK97 family [Megasphaera vaginalis (ex Srinivasan et al. 2021)]